jgi:hypothetical protein
VGNRKVVTQENTSMVSGCEQLVRGQMWAGIYTNNHQFLVLTEDCVLVSFSMVSCDSRRLEAVMVYGTETLQHH